MPWTQPVSLEQTPSFIVFAVSWPPPVRRVMALPRPVSWTIDEQAFHSKGPYYMKVNGQRRLTHCAIRRELHYLWLGYAAKQDVSLCLSLYSYI